MLKKLLHHLGLAAAVAAAALAPASAMASPASAFAGQPKASPAPEAPRAVRPIIVIEDEATPRPTPSPTPDRTPYLDYYPSYPSPTPTPTVTPEPIRTTPLPTVPHLPSADAEAEGLGRAIATEAALAYADDVASSETVTYAASSAAFWDKAMAELAQGQWLAEAGPEAAARSAAGPDEALAAAKDFAARAVAEGQGEAVGAWLAGRAAERRRAWPAGP